MKSEFEKSYDLGSSTDAGSTAAENLEHRVKDGDFNNIVGLLNVLARQLELNMHECVKDYKVISDYCIAQISDNENRSHDEQQARVVQSLQYQDRSTQRIEHVVDSLRALATNLFSESWKEIDVDLVAEVRKTETFFSECQTRELHSLASGICSLAPGFDEPGSDKAINRENDTRPDQNSGNGLELF